MGKIMNKLWVVGVACLLAPTLSSAVVSGAGGSPIGRFILAENAKVIRADGTFTASKKDSVRSLDTISVPLAGKAQWWTTDDSLFAIGPGSALQVNQYVRPGGGGTGVLDLTLQRGGFRSIAGALGKGGNQYRVQTQYARLDVNGADFWAIQCAGDCYDSNKKPLPDGLFVGVNQGTVTVSNTMGSLNLGPGQFARVASPPATIPKLPVIYARFSGAFRFGSGLDVLFEEFRIESGIEQELPVP